MGKVNPDASAVPGTTHRRSRCVVPAGPSSAAGGVFRVSWRCWISHKVPAMTAVRASAARDAGPPAWSVCTNDAPASVAPSTWATRDEPRAPTAWPRRPR